LCFKGAARLSASISEKLVPELRARFADRFMHTGDGGELVAVFRAPHPDVGAIEIYDHGTEAVVVATKFSHTHFGGYGPNLPESERGERIAGEVVRFLEDVFADRIEFFGNPERGGWRPRKAKGRGLASRLVFGKKTYVWSGPLQEGG
jgi:hypothetical protein